jgi:hypothetical protein
MTTPNPTPNIMPGAQQGEPNPQLQQPISTGQQPPAPQAPPADSAPQTPPAQPTPAQKPPEKGDDKPEPDWKAHARTWEQRAKENEEKAKKWEEAEAAKRTKEENDRIAIQQAEERARRAEENLARERVARTTGVEPEFLGGGTEEEMRATAQRLLEWRSQVAQQIPPQPPPPQTSAAPASTVTGGAAPIGTSPNGIQQLTIDQFRALPDHEKMVAVRAGQCESLGIGKPKEQRRMGNEVEIGAHGGRQ